jgi:hypothetical protein
MDDKALSPVDEGERAVFIQYVMREASLYHYHLFGSLGEKELQPLREFLVCRPGSSWYQCYLLCNEGTSCKL